MSQLDPQLLAAALQPLELPAEELHRLSESVVALPRIGVRLRPGAEPSTLPFPTTPVPWHPQGRFLEDSVAGVIRPGSLLEFAAGEYYTQDAGSLLALALLNPRPGELVCDLCAAPGGKSTGILEAIGDRGWLLSNEAVQSRSAVLQFNLSRHGSTRYVVSGFDPDRLAEHAAGSFDAVLVDAPCSGQSLVGRGKQSLSAFSQQAMDHCAARQSRILDAACRLVRPGGRLVYSTCTLAYVENEGQIQDFLGRHADWTLVSPSALSETCGGIQTDWGVRVWPQRHGCGGAFAARLRYEPPESTDPTSPSAAGRMSALRGGRLPPELSFAEWGELREVSTFLLGDQCFGWPSDVPEDLLALARGGPEVAFRKGQTWFPSYALAMRRASDWSPRQVWELDDQAARKYSQGQTVMGSQRGWSVGCWRGRAMGWLKGDGRQGKNHLPKGGRLAAS